MAALRNSVLCSENPHNQTLAIPMAMRVYLTSCDVIDWQHPHIAQLAQRLRATTPSQTALQCFNWVRDEIAYCLDAGREEVSCIESDVLALGTSFCYGKSHTQRHGQSWSRL